MKILRTTYLVAAMTLSLTVHAADVSFRGGSYNVIALNGEKNTGLDKIFVAYDSSQLTEMVISGVQPSAEISKYSNLGGGFAQPVQYRMEGADAVIDNPEGDTGYIIGGDRPYYIWLVNYKPYMLTLESAEGSPQQDCENTKVQVTGAGVPIHYFSVDGRQCELSRDIEVDYLTLEWDEESEAYNQVSRTKTLSHLTNPITITPPFYCNTVVEISGDRFLEEWGFGRSIKSQLVYANGLSVHTTAEQTNIPEDDPEGDASNMIKTEVNGMGGSAPADISFRAYTTDAVIHNEWQISRDSEFQNIDSRFNDQNLDYTFLEEGTYYIRFVGSNSNGTCETVGETYTVGIGSSELRIPNAFTPNDDGVNDKWKVSYRSLTSFKCYIFDRYGTQLYHFTDPNDGWDGKYNGKKVLPGVYFYVIEAKGADGKKYHKKGDINIVKSKRHGSSTAPTE